MCHPLLHALSTPIQQQWFQLFCGKWPVDLVRVKGYSQLAPRILLVYLFSVLLARFVCMRNNGYKFCKFIVYNT